MPRRHTPVQGPETRRAERSLGWLGFACEPRRWRTGVRKPTPATRFDRLFHNRSRVLALGWILLGSLAPGAGAVRAAEPAYHRDVAPILQKHCQDCHRP